MFIENNDDEEVTIVDQQPSSKNVRIECDSEKDLEINSINSGGRKTKKFKNRRKGFSKKQI